jgi:hypothetical protein
MTLISSLLNWESAEHALVRALAQHPQKESLRVLAANEALILVRNWYGRLMLLLPCSKDELARSPCGPLVDDLQKAVGNLALSPWVLCRDELFDAASYWSDPSLIQLFKEDASGKALALLLLERQDKERDWLTPANTTVNSTRLTKRCVFFSVKGGVGRSSALTMLAITLAMRGRRVLVVDGDFESPGLSSSLLSTGDGQPEYGVVDWLTAQALGADAQSLARMALENAVAPSPLNARLALQGQVLVAPAYGSQTEAYVSKLARIYRQSQDGKAYAQRLNEFLSATETQHKIDITLFDCRAGIDDTAAAAITQLHADISFLFAVNTSQTWDSYRLLFKHLRRNPALFTTPLLEGEDDEPWELRRSLRMVSALTPQEHGPYVGYFDSLQQNAYETFSEIYDEDSGEDAEAFAPAPGDTEAPHAALRVQWVEALRALSPLTEPGQLTDAINQAAFADFLNRAITLLGVDDEHID